MKTKINRVKIFKFLLFVIIFLVIALILVKCISKISVNKKEKENEVTLKPPEIDEGAIYEEDPYKDTKDMYMGGNSGNIDINNLKNAEKKDDEKINTSDKIKQNKEFGGLVFSDMDLKSHMGITVFKAKVENKSDKIFKSRNFSIKFLDSDKKEIGNLTIYVPDLKPGSSSTIDSSITEDYVNAFDIVIEEIK